MPTWSGPNKPSLLWKLAQKNSGALTPEHHLINILVYRILDVSRLSNMMSITSSWRRIDPTFLQLTKNPKSNMAETWFVGRKYVVFRQNTLYLSQVSGIKFEGDTTWNWTCWDFMRDKRCLNSEKDCSLWVFEKWTVRGAEKRKEVSFSYSKWKWENSNVSVFCWGGKTSQCLSVINCQMVHIAFFLFGSFCASRSGKTF